MHESRLVEEGEHAVEIFKIILEKRQSFTLGREGAENGPLEEVAKDFGLPVRPLVVVEGNIGDHLLERLIPSLLVDPLDALGRENGEAR